MIKVTPNIIARIDDVAHQIGPPEPDKLGPFPGAMLGPYCAELCESPIEVLFLASFINLGAFDHGFTLTPEPLPRKRYGKRAELLRDIEAQKVGAVIAPQVGVGPYRADFIVGFPDAELNGWIVNVECDGHDFHDVTDAQVARDRARDRFFLSMGIPVMRFSGSEIWREPEACVHQIINAFYDAAISASAVAEARAVASGGDR